jgi:hypothetical protein
MELSPHAEKQCKRRGIDPELVLLMAEGRVEGAVRFGKHEISLRREDGTELVVKMHGRYWIATAYVRDKEYVEKIWTDRKNREDQWDQGRKEGLLEAAQAVEDSMIFNCGTPEMKNALRNRVTMLRRLALEDDYNPLSSPRCACKAILAPPEGSVSEYGDLIHALDGCFPAGGGEVIRC